MAYASALPAPHPVVQLIDAAYEEDARKEAPFRSHLGGSMIGEKCERKLVYSFRWAKLPSHGGRILRLFGRGHREEELFVKYLRRIGANVREFSERLMYHPESSSYFTQGWDDDSNPDGMAIDVSEDPAHVKAAAAQGVERKQWRILDVDGHFGGSLDGMLDNLPGMPDLDEEMLCEFKTHNTKSFVNLKNEGVKNAKPVHWFQMQVYMFKKKLKRALYLAVNKNDEELYAEIVEADYEVGAGLILKAERVIRAKKLPDRIGPHASWMDCKFCEFSSICHGGAPMHKSCRSCVNATPVADGQWQCGLWNAIIPVDAIPFGCDSYKPITD